MIVYIFLMIFFLVAACIGCLLIWVWIEQNQYQKEQQQQNYEYLKKVKKPEEDITDL